MPVVAAFFALIVVFVLLAAIGVALWWVISTAAVGLVLGGLARAVIPGRQPIGILATIITGWAGSLIGGAIGRGVWGYHHHRLFTLLIEVGVAAVGVLAWSEHDRRQVRSAAPHRIIDI